MINENKTAFTIGHEKNYDEVLEREPTVQKVGRYLGYPGGWVWEKAEDAKSFIDQSSFSFRAAVYELRLRNGVDADFSAVPGEDGVYNLLHDAEIIKKIEL